MENTQGNFTTSISSIDSKQTRWVDGTPTYEVPRSLSGRSIHLTMLTKWSWSWSWMTYCHRPCAMSIGPPSLRYSYFKIWPWRTMVKVMCVVKGQVHGWPSKFKGKVMVNVKPIGHIWGLEFNRYVCFSIRGNRTTFGWDIGNSIFELVNSRSRSWPRSNLVVTFEALEFNQYVCFSFRGNQTIFGWYIANSIFDLENSKSRALPRSNPMVTFEPWSSIDMLAFRFVAMGLFLAEIKQISYLTLANLAQGHGENRPKYNQAICRSGPTIVPKLKKIQKIVEKLSREQESAAVVGGGGGGVRTSTKT